MESVRCYLCDHEFVEGEEPWLMFEQRLREDGHVECSLADLLAAILNKHLEEALAHSTLLCDSCNADVLEYENLEKQFSQIRERILSSYKENSTIQHINSLLNRTAINNETLAHQVDASTLLLPEDIDHLSNSEYAAIADMDLIEEIQDEEVDLEGSEDICGIGNDNVPANSGDDFIENDSAEVTTDNFDFAAFNEHVAQNSLPSGVLNMSDGLVNLEVAEKSVEVQDMPMGAQDIIVYDVNSVQCDLIVQQDKCEDLKNYVNSEDEDLKYVISEGLFKTKTEAEQAQEQTTETDVVVIANDQEEKPVTVSSKIAPEPVCRKEGDFFVCLLCDVSTQFERQTLVEHYQELHRTKFYMCEQCHTAFETRQDLKTHNEIGHLIQCEFCEKSFTNIRIYRVHKRTHFGTAKSFECPVCQKLYVSKAILDEHMNTHTGVRPFQCTECPKDFASKYTLMTHMKIHKERPRPFQCDECDKRFLNQQNLNQHKKLHVSVKAFQCAVCNKAFTTQHSLQVHKVVHSGQRPFICRICGKSFARRPEIKDHERIHTGERPFKCEFCPMAFAQRTNLATHRKSTHLNEKLHKCEICLRSFKRKRLLDYHIQAIHTGERPHKCEVCGAGFVYPEHFKKHMLIHSGKKPYACEVCGKQFNSRDNRNAHRFVHSDKKPYECMECGAGFMRKPLLLTHMKQTKHINDTIIINQPQFTQHQTIKTVETASISTPKFSTTFNNSHQEESDVDVDNDLQSQEVSDETLEKIILKSGNFLSHSVPVSSLYEKTIHDDVDDENVMAVVSEHLIKAELDDVKYLEFDDLERDTHQTLTWVDIGGDDKV